MSYIQCKSNASLTKSQRWKANLKRAFFQTILLHPKRQNQSTEVPVNVKLALQLDILFLKLGVL